MIVDFYNQNQNRRYPFRERVSLMDRDDRQLPEGLLVDASLTVDERYGDEVYVSSVTRRGNFCTIVFSSVLTREPLGLVSSRDLDQDARLSHQRTSVLNVQPLQAGFVGHVVLGERFTDMEDGSWIFDDPQASTLQARVVYSTVTPISQRIGVLYGARPLSGDVEFSVGGDIGIEFETRILDGRPRTAVVFGLQGSGVELLAQYAAQQPRPEARSCGDPQPIESINLVQPDCCGRIFIELRGCAVPMPITNHCGVVLNCPLTLEDICPERENFRDTDNRDQCQTQTGDNAINPFKNQPDAPQRWQL